MTETKKSKVGEYDVTAMHKHTIGATNTSGVTTNPVWNDRMKSDEALRLKMLLSGANLLSQETSASGVATRLGNIWNENSFVYPVLQPIKKCKSSRDGSNALSLSPWKSSRGAIVIQVQNVLNALFDDCIGEVVIPLSSLVNDENRSLDGHIVRGWAYLQAVGANYDELEIIDDVSTDGSQMEDIIGVNYEEVSRGDISSDFLDNERTDNLPIGDDIDSEVGGATGNGSRSHDGATEDNFSHEEDRQSHDMSTDSRAAIYISCSLTLPRATDQVSDVEKEASIVVAQEMIQTASMSKENIGMIGSSINTINTVRGMGGNAQWLQNTLGNLLDFVESFRNLFTWACPQKSMLVFSALSMVWIVLCIIPTRFIILSAGLYEFVGKHIMTAFSVDSSEDGNESDDDEENEENSIDNQPSIPILTHFYNLVAAVPNDEDLRRAYFWEARRMGGVERDDLAQSKRISRLKSLWRARWYGELYLKVSANAAGTGWEWRNIFTILQGHRLVWWVSSHDFDRGNKPLGQILFAGHAGLAGLSPLDLRQMQKNEFSRAISVFGRGEIEQQKIILLASSEEEKEWIERLITEVTLDPKID
uniref:Uncharacterized protein n=2 Tax=Leptocylindrus danicus TaxID=163516 RepID=A0A7S2KQJ6_9STRA